MQNVFQDREDLVPTRRSLIERLKKANAHADWQEFFDIYWRLIYSTAFKAGLSCDECEEVVQETVISVFRQLPRFAYEPSKGSFKGWLFQLAKWRIADQFRKRGRLVLGLPEEELHASVEAMGSAYPELGAHWEEEWANNLLQAAMERLKREVDPKHYQIFFLRDIKGWKGRRVATWLGVSITSVYTVRHRIRKLLKKIVVELESSPETAIRFHEKE